MAFGMYFRPTGFTPAVYDNVVKQLDEAGLASARCQVAGSIAPWRWTAVSVLDVWDSMEQFQKFGETLLPIMKKMVLTPANPKS